jgi:hypothetical protein
LRLYEVDRRWLPKRLSAPKRCTEHGAPGSQRQETRSRVLRVFVHQALVPSCTGRGNAVYLPNLKAI